MGLLGNKSLTMTYFHRRSSTIIGAKAFHCPVRDGKEWDHLAMVVKRNWLHEARCLLRRRTWCQSGKKRNATLGLGAACRLRGRRKRSSRCNVYVWVCVVVYGARYWCCVAQPLAGGDFICLNGT